jgi:hypothetical protein
MKYWRKMSAFYVGGNNHPSIDLLIGVQSRRSFELSETCQQVEASGRIGNFSMLYFKRN